MEFDWWRALTNREAHDNCDLTLSILKELYSAMPDAFYRSYWAQTWGDDAGTFEAKYGDDADMCIDWRGIAIDLCKEAADWAARRKE